MSQPEQMPRVIVVDDDPISLEFLRLHLSDAGYAVQVAENGADALELLRQGARIIVSDWIMPGMDGMELCKAVRSHHGKYVYFIMVTSNADKASLLRAFGTGVDDFLGKPLHEGELLARLHAGVRTINLQDELERRAEVLTQANDQLTRANQRLREMAITDELTELPNRRYAMMRLQEEWGRAERTSQPLSCAIIDLDNFRQINDTHGHGVGDVALRQVVGLLRENLRSVDVIHRIGGDELLILFPNQIAENVLIPMERCRQAVASQPLCEPRHLLRATISVGIATRTSAMDRPHNLLHAADSMLLAAKRADGNRVCAPSPVAQRAAS